MVAPAAGRSCAPDADAAGCLTLTSTSTARRGSGGGRGRIAYHGALRLEALNAYGGPVCARCGSTERLQLDHVNGDGAQHRLQLTPAIPGGADMRSTVR